MLENITLDSVLRDYYYSIDSKKLSDNNITINEELEISNSSEKYVIRLARFLNESYYKGYIISSSILSRLMDIIEYTGYEYQVLESYISILNDSMYQILDDLECKPDFDKLDLNAENCINFVTKYSETVKDIPVENTVVKNTIIPHFKEPTVEESEFDLHILKEIVDPISLIYEDIRANDCQFNKLVEVLYVMYKTKPNEFLISVQGFKSEALFFLLNETDYDIIDTCVNNIDSLNGLRHYIKGYYTYIGEKCDKLTIAMIENIRRIFTILTINFTVNQLAMVVSDDYEFWKQLNDSTNIEKLHDAINLYENDPKTYKVYNSIDIIHKLDDYHINDRYYIARYILLNMDYRIFCDNFIQIATDLYKNFTIGASYELLRECIEGLTKLNIEQVHDELLKLSNCLNTVTINDDMICLCEYARDIISDNLKL